MAEALKRWDEAAQEWKVVTSVTRLEVQAGGGMGCWEIMTEFLIKGVLNWETGLTLTNIIID